MSWCLHDGTNTVEGSPQLWSSKRCYEEDEENTDTTTGNIEQDSRTSFRDSDNTVSSRGSNHPSAKLQELLGLTDIQIPRYHLTDDDIHNINWSRTVTHVNISDNNLLSFPTVITAQCPNLQELDISNNSIHGQLRVDALHVKISGLSELNVSFNHITSIADEFGLVFPYLKTVDVSYNRISKIDAKFLSNLNCLQHLSLDGNQISVPPVHICLRGVAAMRRYYKAMPQDADAIRNSSDLVSVQSSTSVRDFSSSRKGGGLLGRQLTTEQSYMPNLIEVVVTSPVPVATATTHDMRKSVLDNVRACSFTKGVKRLSSLVDIMKERGNSTNNGSGHGQATSSSSATSAASGVQIPLAQGQFESAVPLIPTSAPLGTNSSNDRMNSSITSIPYTTPMIQSITEAPKFPSLPRSISAPLSQSTLRSLAERKKVVKQDPNVNNTVKLVVLGASGAGKTSMVQRLKHGVNVEERNGKSGNRIGVDIVECDIAKSDSDVKFSVWDFAGAGGSHHAINELFFSPMAIYIIVWDMHRTAQTKRNRSSSLCTHSATDIGANPFSLAYESDDEDESDILRDDASEADEKDFMEATLDRDMDEKVLTYIDCIQNRVPGAVIIPVCSHEDEFDSSTLESARRAYTLRERILHHEQLHIEHLQRKLEQCGNRRQDLQRLRRMLTNRPKFVFASASDFAPAIRVSSKRCTGYELLHQRLSTVATGEHFVGHIGCILPRYYATVRQCVRDMRAKFKLIQFQHFLEALRNANIEETGQLTEENVTDALLFMTCTGETSFYTHGKDAHSYVFLNPRWLLAAVGCIVRSDLAKVIRKLRGNEHAPPPLRSTTLIHGNFPIVSNTDVESLWKMEVVTRKGAQRAEEYSACDFNSDERLSVFTFVQQLLLHFHIFVPMDLDRHDCEDDQENQLAVTARINKNPQPQKSQLPSHYFLPSLLMANDNADDFDATFSYKCVDFWKAALCHAWCFHDGVPPGVMERITGFVLREVYGAILFQDPVEHAGSEQVATVRHQRQLKVLQIHCWRGAFSLLLGVKDADNNMSSHVEVFCHVVNGDRDSPSSRSRRIAVSAKGNVKDDGKLIWDGGYSLVLASIEKALSSNYYAGMELEREILCPICLAHYPIQDTKYWTDIFVKECATNGVSSLRCDRGHTCCTALVSGMHDAVASNELSKQEYNYRGSREEMEMMNDVAASGKAMHMHSGLISPSLPLVKQQNDDIIGVKELFSSVVLIGLYDGDEQQMVRVGSGFIADSNRGLIVTAAHNVICFDEGEDFGNFYFGLREPKVFVGMNGNGASDEAVFRYQAVIVSADVGTVDACVLRIITKLENDVAGHDASNLHNQAEAPIRRKTLKSQEALIHMSEQSELPQLEESVRILGHNQETFMKAERLINCCADFTVGHVRQIWKRPKHVVIADNNNCSGQIKQSHPNKLDPQIWIVLDCKTINGHSGGPCVNMQGEVVGILSHADENGHRCFIVPAREWQPLIKRAKQQFRRGTTQ